MLAHASGQIQGPVQGKAPREKIHEPQLSDVILSPRGLDVGTISSHVIKHYLFMRGLLPAQFDELANLLRQVIRHSMISDGSEVASCDVS